MEYQIRGAEHSLVSVTPYEDGVWISINRHCGYTSTKLSREQAEQLRDALVAIMSETQDVE